MRCQAFSCKNFRKVFDLGNRRGGQLVNFFFKESKIYADKIKEIDEEIRQVLHEERSDERSNALGNLQYQKSFKKKKQREFIESELQRLSDEIGEGNIQFEFKKIPLAEEKAEAWQINTDSCPKVYFVLSQINKNLQTVYGVKQVNRNKIIPQLREALHNRMDKIVIRIDIESFYGNINREKLLEQLYQDNLLSKKTRSFLRRIFSKYERKSNNSKGLPLGLGLSAYLAELYMQNFDRIFKQHPECSYYARYVDDMIFVFHPNPKTPIRRNLEKKSCEYFCLIQEELRKLELDLNIDKTEWLPMLEEGKNKTFEYLGYSIELQEKEISLDISRAKQNRYKRKIEAAFKSYEKMYRRRPKKAFRLLKDRIRYLTSNTRLINNKKHVLVGIYFSNRFLTKKANLVAFDNMLRHKIAKYIQSDALKKELEFYSFVKGFEEKRFMKLPQVSKLKEIKKVWLNIK